MAHHPEVWVVIGGGIAIASAVGVAVAQAVRARRRRTALLDDTRQFIALNRSGKAERGDLDRFAAASPSPTAASAAILALRRRIVEQATHELRLRNLTARATLGSGTRQALATALQDSRHAFTAMERELDVLAEGTHPNGGPRASRRSLDPQH